MANETETDRHPIRFLFRIALLGAIVFGIARLVSTMKREYFGLTESEAMDKLVDKISARLGQETAEEIAGQVIPKLREQGLIKPDPVEAEDESEDSEATADTGA